MRLLRAKGSDPNLQDSNGNTVLHMLVVHDKKVSLETQTVMPEISVLLNIF